jgi:hypothetical protein
LIRCAETLFSGSTAWQTLVKVYEPQSPMRYRRVEMLLNIPCHPMAWNRGHIERYLSSRNPARGVAVHPDIPATEHVEVNLFETSLFIFFLAAFMPIVFLSSHVWSSFACDSPGRRCWREIPVTLLLCPVIVDNRFVESLVFIPLRVICPILFNGSLK